MADPRARRAGLLALGLLFATGGAATLVRARYTAMGAPRLVASTVLLVIGLLCLLATLRRPPAS